MQRYDCRDRQELENLQQDFDWERGERHQSPCASVAELRPIGHECG